MNNDPYHRDSCSTIIEGDYLWFQLLIKVFTTMRHTRDDRAELVALCRRVYAGNSAELINIEDFAENYTPEKAIFYYTKPMCLFRMLNTALRRRDIETLIVFRFFIHDLHRQLSHMQKAAASGSSLSIVYRGQLMSETSLQDFRNKCTDAGSLQPYYISFHSFLSTSTDRTMAQMFVPTGEGELRSVMLEIYIDPSARYAKPYADISSESQFEVEQEVLFMLGSIFKLEGMGHEGNIPVIKLRLASETEPKIRNLSRYMKKTLKKRSDMISLADVLRMMGQYRKANNYYFTALQTLRKKDKKKAGYCYAGLGQVAVLTREYDWAIGCHLSALDVALSDRDRSIAYRIEGDAYLGKGYLKCAQRSYESALEIDKQIYGEESLKVAGLYWSMGLVSSKHRWYKRALEQYRLALAIQKKLLPKKHYHIGRTYESMGCVYENISGREERALNCYVKADGIYRYSITTNHPDFHGNIENIRRSECDESSSRYHR